MYSAIRYPASFFDLAYPCLTFVFYSGILYIWILPIIHFLVIFHKSDFISANTGFNIIYYITMKYNIYNDLLNIKNKEDLYNKKVNIITNDNIDLSHYIFSKLPDQKKDILLKHLSKYKFKTKTHILIDIDDTIYPGSSGGTNVSYKTNEIYPFLMILLNLFIEKSCTSNFVTILTARPRFLRKNVINHFNKIFTDFKFDVLPGKIKHLSEGVGDFIDKYFISYVKKTRNKNINTNVSDQNLIPYYKKMALRKYESYKKYSLLFPEFEFIFIGDSGQGDINTSISMMTNNTNVKLCFIHNITQVKKKQIFKKYKESNFRFNIYSKSIKNRLKSKNILFFDTYLDVFKILYDKKYMNDSNKKIMKTEIKKYMNISHDKFISPILYNRFIESISNYS